ncbi:hypothetical protein ABEB36_013335 [Hypothenemus hampei]|uniref:Alpha-mannosidase n=1 Tax=Hypothenemus hampei TaxID=57062 RepID=A0ABD1E7V1_HYPHA
MLIRATFTLSLLTLTVSRSFDSGSSTINCVKCHATDPEKINVHLIHHSHDDVGWLKTVDQYYWGLNQSIARVGVQYIMTSVANALENYPDRRFIQVETAFFWMWWQNQEEVMRQKFKKLVENGQIEIVNGAWSMNDEACVNYQSIIDQFTWGFGILNDTLGECGQPTIAWQIDPFGHTREHGSMMTKMAFDALFFGHDHVIFGSAFGSDNTYHTPGGLCWDYLCSDDAIDDDPSSPGYNVNVKITSFVNDVKNYAKYYKTNHVIITMGGDFYYQAAELNFRNSDKLIKAFQNNTEVNLLYSTPSCYLNAVYQSQPVLETKTDDFLPYSNADDTFWVGYFTSRPNFKYFERVSHNILQVGKQLYSLARASGVSNLNVDLLNGLRQANGVVQHHDAITGTEKQHVNDDYVKMIHRGIIEVESQFSIIFNNLLNQSLPQLTSCLEANNSICHTSQTYDEFLVLVYNPLATPVDHIIRLPVQNASYSVEGPNGNIQSDVLEPISNFTFIKREEGPIVGGQDLVFVADEVPPLGIKLFLVKKGSENITRSKTFDIRSFGNEDLGFDLDENTNLLKSVTMNGQTLEISQNFYYYASHDGSGGRVASGAYIFQPNGEASVFGNASIVRSYRGNVVEEVQQKINDWITQIIRIYKSSSHNYIEFDWLVGPVDVSDKIGKEIITRFQVNNFQNNATFWTDSNGREMIQRILNFRPTFTYDPTKEPIASNYYPVTSKISIIDPERNLQVSVLNDRSQGGSSLNEGQLELMIHRRMLHDDSKGVGEALNEQQFGQGIVTRGRHWLVIGSRNETNKNATVSAQERFLAQQKLLQPWVGLETTGNLSNSKINELILTNYSALTSKLTTILNLITLEPWKNSTYILRLEHSLELNEDPNLAVPIALDIHELFQDFYVENVQEMTLGANKRLETVKGYNWEYLGHMTKKNTYSDDTFIEMKPMDIRTFIVELNRK